MTKTLADMDAASKEGSWFGHRAVRQDDRDVSPASLPANYDLQTKLLDNNSQMLVALIEGMRPMNEPHWKRLADRLETRQKLRWALVDWINEGRRLKSLAPLDFQEALDEFADEKPQAYRGTPHARSA